MNMSEGHEADEYSSLIRQESHDAGSSYGTGRGQGADDENEFDGSVRISADDKFDAVSIWKKNFVLVLGAIMVNMDASMLYAIFRQIASEFNKLDSASWIVTSFIIGTIVSQPLFGKLSDIYGRKAMLIITCWCACIGGIISGTGLSLPVVIIGRVIAGVANAGMSVLVSTIIVDIVPFHQIALWRSVVYASNQIGRSAGLPIGGVITDASSWRWVMLFQVPIYLFVIVYVWYKMDLPKPMTNEDTTEIRVSSTLSRFKRIDFTGAITLAISNLSLLLFLDWAPLSLNPQKELAAFLPLTTWIAFLLVFVYVEAYRATEPIIPLRLLSNRNVACAYAIQFLQGAVQTGLLTTMPLYFRVIQSGSNFWITIRLLFLTLGAMSGTVFSGAFITRTRLYRRLIQTMALVSCLAFTAIFLRWRGSTSWFETVYAFPAGMGFSVALSATFIALTDRLPSSQTAVATTGFYLCLNIGSNIGVGVANLIIQAVLQRRLKRRLLGVPNAQKVIHAIISNINNLERLPKSIKRVAVDAYTTSLVYVWLFFLVCACLSFMVSLTLRRETSLSDKSKDVIERTVIEEDQN